MDNTEAIKSDSTPEPLITSAQNKHANDVIEPRPRVSSFGSQYSIDDTILLSDITAENVKSVNNEYISCHQNDLAEDKSNDDPSILEPKANEDKSTKDERETWFILCVVFPTNMLLGMLWIAFPLFYIEFADFFGASKGVAGFIGSIQNGLQQFLGLITSSPIELYGCRINAMVGSVIVVCGIVLSAFAPNVYWLYVSYGVCTGTSRSQFMRIC